jgi:cytoskeletal protein CcmA (bactofilin family)
MAMFRKSTDKSPPARERGPALRPNATESAISIIGPGMRIEGDLETDGTVRIEGSVHGTIRAGKAVVLGPGGEVAGDIFTQDAVIGGRVSGTVVAESRLELQSSSVIEGEIRARAEHLKLDEGARFNGQIRMLEADEQGGPSRDGGPERAAERSSAPLAEG